MAIATATSCNLLRHGYRFALQITQSSLPSFSKTDPAEAVKIFAWQNIFSANDATEIF